MEENTSIDQNDKRMVITVNEFMIIHQCLVDTYNSWKKIYNDEDCKNDFNFSKDQVQNILGNIYSVYEKVDLLLNDYKKNKNPQEELKN